VGAPLGGGTIRPAGTPWKDGEKRDETTAYHRGAASRNVVMEPTPNPNPLDYQTPPAPPPERPWTLSGRIGLGLALSAVYFGITLAAAFSESEVLIGIVLCLLGWLTEWMNAHRRSQYQVPMERAVLANCIFWGFLIAFSVRRRWRKN